MGLDLYFHKVKPSSNMVNTASVRDLEEDMERQFTAKYKKFANKQLKIVLTTTSLVERANAIKKLYDFTKKCIGDYHWYYDKFVPESTNDEIKDLVEHNIENIYPRADIYFRKANFVYAFFQPYLEDIGGECCIVTKSMVEELIDKCDLVLDAAHKCGLVDKKGYLVKELQDENTKWDDKCAFADKKDGSWKKVAETELPTQDGFFFGSTEYSFWYLYNVKDCVKQFSKLLKNWKEGEIVYNIMSW